MCLPEYVRCSFTSLEFLFYFPLVIFALVFIQFQHGFIKGRLCLRNLLEIFEKVTDAIDKCKPFDCIYIFGFCEVSWSTQLAVLAGAHRSTHALWTTSPARAERAACRRTTDDQDRSSGTLLSDVRLLTTSQKQN